MFRLVDKFLTMEDLSGKNVTEKEEEDCYAIVGNIPKEFHSSDLRAMFSNFINDESKGFKCFHFRHRPEFRHEAGSSGEDKEIKTSSTTCCVIFILKTNLQDLINCYHGKNWVDRHGKYFPSKAFISKIRVKEGEGSSEDLYRTKQEKKQNLSPRTNLEFSQHDLREMIELHPPALMPNGNVGTSLSIFRELIRTCKLPPHVIKKLDLNFSIGKSKKKYSNVPLDYTSLEKGRVLLKSAPNDRDHHLGMNAKQSDLLRESSLLTTDRPETQSSKQDNDENVSEREDNDVVYASGGNGESDEEEWERHESLHNDVTSQERTKERLFEEDIELKWEKGGSGLVFYTDAAFWKQHEEADFDEETADDWDVDMEIYENPGGGDKDSRDLLQMRIEKQWRKGNDIDLNQIGGFEKHTKGFGGQMMRKQGWKEGGCLGSSQKGITEPVFAEGQLPKCKRGLGYYGEKLQRHVKRTKVERIISTVYDELESNEENLFESWRPDKLKNRVANE